MYHLFRKKEVASNENELLKLTKRQVIDLEIEWEETANKNLEIYRTQLDKAHDACEEIRKVLDKHNISYRKPSNKLFTKGKGYKWYLDILKQIDSEHKVRQWDIPYEKPRVTIKGDYGGRSCESLIDAWETVTKREQKQASDKLKQAKDILTRTKLIIKYGLDDETREDLASWDEIMEKILSKNKYLMLGHYLMKNREDWSCGFNYVKYGLNNFEVTSDNDQYIFDELQGILNDPDISDGRIFRDCGCNYNFLFGLVDNKELSEDYDTAYEFSDKY